MGWKKLLQFGIRGRLYLLVGMFASVAPRWQPALIWLQSQHAFGPEA